MEKNRYGLRWRANIRDEELMNKDKNFKELKGMDTRETLVWKYQSQSNTNLFPIWRTRVPWKGSMVKSGWNTGQVVKASLTNKRWITVRYYSCYGLE